MSREKEKKQGGWGREIEFYVIMRHLLILFYTHI